MKRDFLENLLKDLEIEDSVKKAIIQSVLDENGTDINNERAKTEGVKNDLKVKNALIEELNTKIKEKESLDIEEIKKQAREEGKAEGSKEFDEFKKKEALKKSIKGARDVDLVIAKLDKNKIKYEKDDKGEYTVTGVDEQVDSLKEKSYFLFKDEGSSEEINIELGGEHSKDPSKLDFDFGFTPIHPIETNK